MTLSSSWMSRKDAFTISQMSWKVVNHTKPLGIGYIEKISKNKIKWVGATDDP
jgi:hypothetical protein